MSPPVESDTRDLARRLSEAEATIEALLSGQIDAVVDSKSHTPILLSNAQTALRESEERYRRIVETANEGISIVDADSVLTFVNPRFAEMLGYPAEEIVGRSLFHIVPDSDRAATALRVEHSRQGISEDLEVAYVRKDGSELWTLLRTSPIRDAAGTWAGTLGMTTDWTRYRQAVEALRTAEERTRFALEAAGVGIWDMDYTTGVQRWSQGLEAHYGLEPGTFKGTFEAFVELIHPADRASVLETLDKAVKSGSDFSFQNRAIWPDGTVRWLNGTGRVLLGGHGAAVRAVGISLDVTERHRLEEQFQQAQKMEAVGRLAGGIAHDFNNLLTVILGFCELSVAALDPGDPRQADLAEIQQAGERAAGLTRQLLAFSRKQIIEPTLLDLNAVVTGLLPMLRPLIGEDLQIGWKPRRELALITADRGQVEQIVMNLAVNARDAMPDGGVLTIETGHVDLDENYAGTHLAAAPGSYVALTVTDTGTGMTAEVQARLFEPFFTTKEPGKGTGLGLATVYGIVARCGGTIGVDTEIGRGTSFKVYFPKADAVELVVNPPPAPPTRPRVGTQTVLVVEDEAGLRLLTRRLLQRQGYTVLVAADADEARRLFEDHPSIDVLLTDVVMPGASGPELTRELVEQRPGLKVIYMSGYTEEAIVRHGVLKPGIAFLHKPFTSRSLGDKVREVIER